VSSMVTDLEQCFCFFDNWSRCKNWNRKRVVKCSYTTIKDYMIDPQSLSGILSNLSSVTVFVIDLHISTSQIGNISKQTTLRIAQAHSPLPQPPFRSKHELRREKHIKAIRFVLLTTGDKSNPPLVPFASQVQQCVPTATLGRGNRRMKAFSPVSSHTHQHNAP
jgi:hypothetical protein